MKNTIKNLQGVNKITNLNQHDPLHDLMNTPVEQEPEETHKGLLFLSHKYCYVKDCPEPWIDFDWYRDYQPADKRDDGQKFWPPHKRYCDIMHLDGTVSREVLISRHYWHAPITASYTREKPEYILNPQTALNMAKYELEHPQEEQDRFGFPYYPDGMTNATRYQLIIDELLHYDLID